MVNELEEEFFDNLPPASSRPTIISDEDLNGRKKFLEPKAA